MLQPMQPMGQQQKPGMNMPKAPGQQMMPAGAAMQRGILPGGIASNPEDIKAAYGGTPQGQQKLQQAAGQGDYLSAIALSQILEEEREKKASMAAPQGGKPPSIVDQKRQEAVELRRQDLEEQQAKRLGMEQQRSQGAMAQMVQQAARPQMPGIAGLPAQNVAQPQAMAAGGIVAFSGEDGSVVEKPTEQEVRPVGPDPYAKMSNRQILESYGRRELGTDRAEAERRKREEYMRFAGYSPEEKARQEKRIAEMEAYDRQAYDPERLRNEGLASFLMGAANTGNIGETLARAGTSGLNYSNKMRELERQRMADRQKQAEAWDEAQHGARVKGYEAGVGEGKEVLQGQRAGIAGLGDVLKADAASARIGAGSSSREMENARQEYEGNPEIKNLVAKLKDYEIGTPEYNQILARMQQIEKAVYDKWKLTPPSTGVPQAVEAPKKESTWDKITGFFSGDKSQSAAPQAALPLPADKNQLVTGQVYNTSKGPARWNGTAFTQ